ncbi:Autoinducer 2 sensor kinase/phosphatase LuxQ [Maioricimonas rarisocia]|uniref:histidine kinase n=1 Tax=Maioricimonas rarisocia TaxID=2528026 RepID=A0A517Z0M4_9PLAN|nr:ATP-binding protein [Maioricimonas rarisocia]QDU36015.1 Autoinducer 2 sensor kinase/phosphatase LuxQ [Maioricimonas rarisocia]
MTPEAFSVFANLVPDALLLLDVHGRIIEASPRAAQMFGEDGESLAGRPLGDLTKDSPEALQEHFRLCRRSRDEVLGAVHPHCAQAPRRMFARLLNRGDKHAEKYLLRIPVEDRAVGQFVLLNQKVDELGREITRRRIAEVELLEQRDLAEFGRDVGLTLAEENTTSAMLQRCVELMVSHLGGAFARIWTLPNGSNELILRASAGIYTHRDGGHSRIRVGQYKIGRIASEQQPLLTNHVVGDEQIHDQEWARREGMVGFAGFPLLVDGRVVGVMAMFSRRALSESVLKAMDSVANSIALGIERKRIAAELKRNAETLRRADQRKNEFLAMLAHELRNPLAPIRSGLELLRLQTGECETLSIMNQQVQHLARLVDDLLDVSRIMRGRIELRSELICLDEVIEHAVTTVRPAMEQHRHTLTVKVSPQRVWLHADRVRLEQVLTNLLTNAAKYTPNGGHVELSCRTEDSSVLVSVRDDGVGIDADFLPEVFELFAQNERELARSEGGLGIGLTLVRQLVHLHDGDVSIRSDGPGQGTEVTVQLPLADPPRSAGDERPRPQTHDIPNCRVLVVDDSIGSAKILRMLLGEIGVGNIELAHDGPSAITAAEAFEPDVIFLDLGLPGLDGFQVAERLRADRQFDATKLIALTGYGTEEDRRKSSEIGFDDHLVKPVSLEQLQQALSTSLNSAS